MSVCFHVVTTLYNVVNIIEKSAIEKEDVNIFEGSKLLLYIVISYDESKELNKVSGDGNVHFFYV